VKYLAIIGAGTMGRGIAQLAAQSKISVCLFDSNPKSFKIAQAKIQEGFAKGISKGKLTQAQAEEAFLRIKEVKELREFKDAQFVIEAVSEKLSLKQSLFRELDSFLPSESILATNTSSLSIKEIIQGLKYPERVLGMHFFNPPVAMRLVEIIGHEGVKDENIKKACQLTEALGRTPVRVKDTPGFLVNRVVRSYYLVAQTLAEQGAGSFVEIDNAIKEQGKLPMGPFELMDFIGLEVNLIITKSIYEKLGKPEHLKPRALQENIVASGCRGRKSGKGFYVYSDGKRGSENPQALVLLPKERHKIDSKELWQKVMRAILAEAQRIVRDGVATEQGVDTALRLAMNFPKGPFEWSKNATKA